MSIQEKSKWFYRLWCFGGRTLDQTENCEQENQQTGREQVNETIDNVVDAQQVCSASTLAPRHLRISHSRLRIIWALPRKPRNGGALRTTGNDDDAWSTWNGFLPGNHDIHAFGIRDSRSSTGYFFVCGTDDDDRIRLTEGDIPSHTDSVDDDRFFRHYSLLHANKTVLEHVNTRRFVAIEQNRNPNRGHKLILTGSDETALDWSVGDQ